MQPNKSQEVKNLVTDIAIKRLEINRLQKELAKRESEENQALWKRYESQ